MRTVLKRMTTVMLLLIMTMIPVSKAHAEPQEGQSTDNTAAQETELSDFENHIWGHVTDSASIKKADSLQLAEKPSGNKKEKRSSRNSRRSSSEKEESKPSKEVKSGDTKKGFFSSSSSSTPRVTVRRQRR